MIVKHKRFKLDLYWPVGSLMPMIFTSKARRPLDGMFARSGEVREYKQGQWKGGGVASPFFCFEDDWICCLGFGLPQEWMRDLRFQGRSGTPQGPAGGVAGLLVAGGFVRFD